MCSIRQSQLNNWATILGNAFHFSSYSPFVLLIRHLFYRVLFFFNYFFLSLINLLVCVSALYTFFSPLLDLHCFISLCNLVLLACKVLKVLTSQKMSYPKRQLNCCLCSIWSSSHLPSMNPLLQPALCKLVVILSKHFGPESHSKKMSAKIHLAALALVLIGWRSWYICHQHVFSSRFQCKRYAVSAITPG